MKIVVTQNLYLNHAQLDRLKKLGDLEIFDDAKNAEEWLNRCQDADIICSKSNYMKNEVYKLKNKYFVIPMVGFSWLDLKKLKKQGISVSNCPGCNKHAVAEWILAMTINLLRNLPKIINSKDCHCLEKPGISIRNKNITILGKGNIGSLVGEIFKTFSANVKYFCINDDLLANTKDADIVVNCLSTNPSTENMLDKNFFANLKHGAYFISITPNDIYDTQALIKMLDSGHLTGAAIDCGSVVPKDSNDPVFSELSNHPRIMATPHTAFFTDVTFQESNDIMIDNVEAWIRGEPKNILDPRFQDRERAKGVEIRLALPEDAVRWCQIRKESWLDVYPNDEYGITKEDILLKDFDSSIAIEEWKDSFLHRTDSKYYSAVVNNMVVGACIAREHDDAYELALIYIDRRFRKQGIGTLLVEQALNEINSNKPMKLNVVCYNQKAINFYKKFGFVENGEIQDQHGRLPNGKTLPEIEMIKKY